MLQHFIYILYVWVIWNSKYHTIRGLNSVLDENESLFTMSMIFLNRYVKQNFESIIQWMKTTLLRDRYRLSSNASKIGFHKGFPTQTCVTKCQNKQREYK